VTVSARCNAHPGMRNDDETLEQLHAKRAHLREKFGPLFGTVAEILFRHDPMQLTAGEESKS
jgi:hypothetical protein